MNQLVVVSFDNIDAARDALRSLRELEQKGQMSFEDTAIVSRDPDGTTRVKNEASGTTETAAVIGGLVGAFAAFVFPVVGIAIGAAAGAAIGASMGTGVEGTFVDEVKANLTPGRSALFLVTRSVNADALTAALRPFEGKVVQTTLAPDLEAALAEALR
ncbi:MAG TPA: DUF1269 domain-containing protein [Candidatus Limnocylindrales bacterium]|nr:DUF1269 domain-containing protein [Candidatus Limnocylindrales bacterium]